MPRVMPERISLSKVRSIFWELCCVWVLKDGKKWWGHKYICGCSLFLKKGQCAHEVYVRWIDGDQSVRAADLAEFTRGQGLRQERDVNAHMRRGHPLVGRPAEIPPVAAWSTMQAIEDSAPGFA